MLVMYNIFITLCIWASWYIERVKSKKLYDDPLIILQVQGRSMVVVVCIWSNVWWSHNKNKKSKRLDMQMCQTLYICKHKLCTHNQCKNHHSPLGVNTTLELVLWNFWMGSPHTRIVRKMPRRKTKSWLWFFYERLLCWELLARCVLGPILDPLDLLLSSHKRGQKLSPLNLGMPMDSATLKILDPPVQG